MKKIIILISAVSNIAIAQTTSVYGPNGQYLGQSFQNGNTTSFYGAAGQYQGQAFQNGNTTSLYGASGQYQGQTFSNAAPAVLPVPLFQQPSLTPQFDSIFGR